jgi:hypothetical protein
VSKKKFLKFVLKGVRRSSNFLVKWVANEEHKVFKKFKKKVPREAQKSCYKNAQKYPIFLKKLPKGAQKIEWAFF